MKVTVRLFGPQARMADRESVELDLADAAPTCAQIRSALAARVPALSESLPGSRFAVNFEYMTDEQTPIEPRDEVALIGMVAGG